ncbi:MAG: hypothetical protein HY040_04530 [Planctomycetes bacterium]|nr:hypothetical protein [Planctomycetota bacterium]
MTLAGHVHNGRIELDDPISLPEGVKVQVELILADSAPQNGEAEDLGKMLLKYAGMAVDLPTDAARNHDHYLYGTPKK